MKARKMKNWEEERCNDDDDDEKGRKRKKLRRKTSKNMELITKWKRKKWETINGKRGRWNEQELTKISEKREKRR